MGFIRLNYCVGSQGSGSEANPRLVRDPIELFISVGYIYTPNPRFDRSRAEGFDEPWRNVDDSDKSASIEAGDAHVAQPGR